MGGFIKEAKGVEPITRGEKIDNEDELVIACTPRCSRDDVLCRVGKTERLAFIGNGVSPKDGAEVTGESLRG